MILRQGHPLLAIDEEGTFDILSGIGTDHRAFVAQLLEYASCVQSPRTGRRDA